MIWSILFISLIFDQRSSQAQMWSAMAQKDVNTTQTVVPLIQERQRERAQTTLPLMKKPSSPVLTRGSSRSISVGSKSVVYQVADPTPLSSCELFRIWRWDGHAMRSVYRGWMSLRVFWSRSRWDGRDSVGVYENWFYEFRYNEDNLVVIDVWQLRRLKSCRRC